MPPTPKWTCLSRKTVLDCPYYTIARERYSLPDGSIGEYTYLDIAGSSMIVPLLEDGRVVMVRQYRYLMGQSSLELPAGGMRRQGDALLNARKELKEEAGYEAQQWKKIGQFAPYNGASNEICHVFVATGLTRVSPEPEPTEEMEIVLLEPARIPRLIREGEIWDGQTITAFTYFFLWEGRWAL